MKHQQRRIHDSDGDNASNSSVLTENTLYSPDDQTAKIIAIIDGVVTESPIGFK